MEEKEEFEEKLEKIKKLVDEMKDKNFTLSQSLEKYEIAANLIKEAGEILQNAKAKIKLIDEKLDD